MSNRCACCGKLLNGTYYPHPETGEAVCSQCYEAASYALSNAYDDGLLSA